MAHYYESFTDEELIGEARVGEARNFLADHLARRLQAKIDEITGPLPDWIKQIEAAKEMASDAELALEQLMKEMVDV